MDVSQGVSVARELIGRRNRREQRLISALSAYEQCPDSASVAMELEVAFRRRYGKSLPAPLLLKMAKAPWGPQKAFEAYARANSSVSCDFDAGELKVGRMANLNHFQKQVRFLGWAILFAICVVVIVTISYFSLRVYNELEVVELMSASYEDYLGLAVFVAYSMGGVVMSLMLGWLAIKSLFVNDRTEEAVSLANILNDSDE